MLSFPRPLKITLLSLLAGLTLFSLLPTPQNADARLVQPPRTAPEFTQKSKDAWIGSEPLSWEKLRGKVVLLDIWTFDCWNCYRSFPWMNDLEARYKDQGLQVIGIHTPEFDHEHKRENVIAKMKEFDLHHPVMQDNDFAYWRTLNNRYWPAYYLVDKKGQIRAMFIGETHKDTNKAQTIEDMVVKLLKE